MACARSVSGAQTVSSRRIGRRVRLGPVYSGSAGQRPDVGIDYRPTETEAPADQLGVAAPQAADRSIGLVGGVFQGAAAATASGGAEYLPHQNGPPRARFRLGPCSR